MIELIYTLVTTHITIISVTLFLHRCQSHKSVEFHPVISHLMRFWLWLSTGMVTKEWVAVHRKHHRFSDIEGDPHSPCVFGLFKVLFKGATLYHECSKDKDMVNTYGVGTPSDWIEHNLYTPYANIGIGILFLFNVWLFGWIGIVIWAVQMIWIPFWAAGVINGIGHYWGYRNGQTRDSSRNIIPWGIIIGGEELHNNHHLDPASPKLKRRWYEIDMGWIYIKLLSLLGLAKIRRFDAV